MGRMTPYEVAMALRTTGAAVTDGWLLWLEKDHEGVMTLRAQSRRPDNGQDLVDLGEIVVALKVPAYAITMLTEALTGSAPGQRVMTQWREDAPG